MEKRKRIQIYPCVVKDCPGKDSEEIVLYTIPERDIGAWCLNLQISPTSIKTTTRVCSRHFEKEWLGLVKLKAGARPTLNIGRRNITALSYDASKPRFNPRKCAIKGCYTTSPPDKVHKFPKDPERYEQWLEICPIKTSSLENKHKYICEKHFDPTDIEESRIKKDALPLASLCFNMRDDSPPNARKTRRRKRKRNLQESQTNMRNHNNTEDEQTDSTYFPVTYDGDEAIDSNNESDNYSTDGLECRNCDTCQNNCEVYLEKYLEAERQLKEAEARHLIETLALQNQIEELTAELEKARKQ